MFAQFVGEMRWRFDLTRYEDVRANAQMIYQYIRASDPGRPDAAAAVRAADHRSGRRVQDMDGRGVSPLIGRPAGRNSAISPPVPVRRGHIEQSS